MNAPHPENDRRHAEAWLHDALELSLFERFRAGSPRALILHGPRSGSHPDIVLLDDARSLILVELKRGVPSLAGANAALQQVQRYATKYAALGAGTLATWYCQHGVDVNASFGCRGEDYFTSHGDHEYGRLNRWSLDNLKRYRSGLADAAVALDILRRDYASHVGQALDGIEQAATLAVGRCILLAEGWPPGFVPTADVPVELWTYTHPRDWVNPAGPLA